VPNSNSTFRCEYIICTHFRGNSSSFAQASACLTGKTKRASGHRLFQRRPDNVYPSAEAASDTPASGLRAPTVIQRKVQKKTKAVVLLDGYGKVLAKYGTQSEASTALGLSPVVVSNAVRSGRVAKEFGSEEECLAYLGIAQPTVIIQSSNRQSAAVRTVPMMNFLLHSL